MKRFNAVPVVRAILNILIAVCICLLTGLGAARAQEPPPEQVFLPQAFNQFRANLPAPVLLAISPTGANFYRVQWKAVTGADDYIVQESSSANFSSARTVYHGPATSWLAADQPYGQRYYRVRAETGPFTSPWSGVRSASLPTPTGDVTILSNHSVYTPLGRPDILNVVGEIYNNTGQKLVMPRITVTFFYKNEPVAALDTFIHIDPVLPYTKAPFIISLKAPEAWDSYRFDPPTYQVAPTVVQPKLTVVYAVSAIEDGQMVIRGQVRNDDTRLATLVSVHAVLFSETGQILDYGELSAKPNLAPGEQASFEIRSPYPHPERVAHIRYQTSGRLP